MTSNDTQFMKLALQEAAKGVGRTAPNPPVGAVIVKKNEVIAKGHHRKAGGPHAEIQALRRAGTRARGATLYLTLEPCVHHGKTPPCLDAVLTAKLKRVVIGMRDPNPVVNGRGIRQLRAKGVDVTTGVLKAECTRFYRPYHIFVTKRRPFIILKAAATLDGMVATAEGISQWVSGEAARRHGHTLRDRVDAILVGRGTVMQDNPRLTTRLGKGRRGHDPVRIILDSRLRILPLSHVIRVRSQAPTWVMTCLGASGIRERALQQEGAEVIRCVPDATGQVQLKDMLRKLAARGIMTLLVEGGPTVYSSFMRQRLVDRLLLYIAPKLLGGRALSLFPGLHISSLAQARHLDNWTVENIGPDLLVAGDL